MSEHHIIADDERTPGGGEHAEGGVYSFEVFDRMLEPQEIALAYATQVRVMRGDFGSGCFGAGVQPFGLYTAPEQRIEVDKRTHLIRFEGETEEGVVIVIEPKA